MVIVSDQSPEKNKTSHETDNEALPHITGSFAQKVIKISIANICSNIGWNSIGSVSLDILTEVVEQWISAAGRFSLSNSNHAGRSEVTLPDLLQALENRLHFSLPELQDYVQNVSPHPISFKVPRFPASTRSSNRLEFASNFECPFGEDVVIGYAHSSDEDLEDDEEQPAQQQDADKKDENAPTDQTGVEEKKKKKFPIKRSDYYDDWLPPFPTDSTAAPDKLAPNGTVENTNTIPVSDYIVSDIEAAPPLSAVTLNKDGSIVALNGKDGKGPDPTFPPLDSDIESESDSDASIQNLSREETNEPRVEKISIKTSRIGKLKQKSTSISPSEKSSRGKISRVNKKPHTSGPVLSIKVSGIISGTPTASPKLSSEPVTVLTAAQEERMDSIIDSVIASVAAHSPSPPPSTAANNSNSKRSKESNVSSKKPKITSKEFVSDDSDDSDDDQEEMDEQQLLQQSFALTLPQLPAASVKESSGSSKKKSKKKLKEQKSQQSKQQQQQQQQQQLQQDKQGKNDQACVSNQEPVVPQGETATLTGSPSPSAAAPSSAPAISSCLPPNPVTTSSAAGSPAVSHIVNSPSSPATIDHSSSVTVASPSKGARKMYPEDIKEAAKILLDISETPVVSASPFNLGQSFGNLSAQSPPAPKVLTLAARKAFIPDVRSVPSSPSEDESNSNSKITSVSDDPKKRKKDKKSKKDKKKKREEKDKDRKKEKKKPSSPADLKVNIKLLKEKEKKQTSDMEPMAPSQSASKKDTSASKESKSSSCILITETIATTSSDGKKGSNAHSPGVRNKSTAKSKANSVVTAAAKKAAVITQTVTETDDQSALCPVCNKADGSDANWVLCDECNKWHHFACVGLRHGDVSEEKKWYCPPCDEKIKEKKKQASSGSSKKRRADPPKAEDESERKRKRKKKPGGRSARPLDKGSDHEENEESDEESITDKAPVSSNVVSTTAASSAKSSRLPSDEWVCEGCTIIDKNIDMIGCDSCDGWYHWKCAGILQAPRDEEVWICADCRRVKPKKKGESKSSKSSKAHLAPSTFRSSTADVSSTAPRKPHIKHTPTLNKGQSKSSILPPAVTSDDQGWMCSACHQSKDISMSMICCDICNLWFHWACVGIQKDPGEKVPWYCGLCSSKAPPK